MNSDLLEANTSAHSDTTWMNMAVRKMEKDLLNWIQFNINIHSNFLFGLPGRRDSGSFAFIAPIS